MPVVWIFGIPARVSSPALKMMARAGALLGDFRTFKNTLQS